MRKLLVRDQITAEVRRRITHGVYAPGSFIPTERELAREFQTSPTTVSRALSELQGNGLIEQAPGRGTRVLALSERRSAGAVAIIASETRSILAAQISQGAQNALSRRSQHFEFLFDADNSTDKLTADAIMRRYAAAFFVQGIGSEPVILELERRQYPYVVANLEKSLDLTCTWVDHGKTTRAAARFLAALGHRRIALITRGLDMFFYRRAFEGYRAALEEAQLPFDESLHIVVPAPDAVDAYLRVREFLSRQPAPTAIVAARDYLANGACRALTEAGRRIGRDVSVIGFDDNSWRQKEPFLTTFREPTFELGAVAAEMLVERLITGWRPVEKQEIEAPLIVRRSVGLCPEGEECAPPCHALLRPCDEFGSDMS